MPRVGHQRPHPAFLLIRWSLTLGCILSIGGQAVAQETGTVRGRVVDDSGMSIALAEVDIRPFDGDRSPAARETDEDGRFVFADLPPGIYTVSAATHDLSGDPYRVRVRSGRIVDVNFRLVAGRDASWLTELAEQEAATRAFSAGLTASRDGDHLRAIEQFERSITRRSDCSACYYNLAVAYVHLERYQEAASAFNQVLELTPDHTAAYYALASVYARLGHTAEADAARGEATRLALAGLAARRERLDDALATAVATVEAGDLARARRLLESLLDQDSGFAPVHFWLGVVLRDENQPSEAASAFQRYLQLDDDGEHATEARAALARLGAR